ncbi:MAG: hypothetical protein LBQ09_06115 [Acidobacteriaceae bacterium]|jgi:hypothetical protein|nr:hypothetical protein [Acidobacteriaceae bacterium]
MRAFGGCVIAAVMTMLVTACATSSPRSTDMNAVAERYVKLVLAVGQHDSGYVDAYYGPPAWKEESEHAKTPLDELGATADSLLRDLAGIPSGDEEMTTLRHEYLRRQVQAVRARIDMLLGKTFTFDEESQALYDAVAPSHPESFFERAIADLDKRLPGTGSVADRLETFRQQFVIPKDRLSNVFDRAIAECRQRTLAHVALPPTESFTVEYVTNKSWSGYNWYQGQYRSLIQVNTDLPIFIDRAIDLACHEGYPGHHAYNVLLEQHLVNERGWVEMSVYPLFSPQSLVAEGSANYGVDVAFPGDERIAFERDVLFPAAGLDGSKAAEYDAVMALADTLSYAGNEAARQYLDKKIDRAAAAAWLTKFALMAPARAEQRTRFMDDYRSYVINYNLGKDLVRDYVEARSGTPADPSRRWKVFTELLSSPRLPSGLR